MFEGFCRRRFRRDCRFRVSASPYSFVLFQALFHRTWATVSPMSIPPSRLFRDEPTHQTAPIIPFPALGSGRRPISRRRSQGIEQDPTQSTPEFPQGSATAGGPENPSQPQPAPYRRAREIRRQEARRLRPLDKDPAPVLLFNELRGVVPLLCMHGLPIGFSGNYEQSLI